jgi:hypothetical protein
VRFCQQVTRQLACDRCGSPSRAVRWVSQTNQVVEDCPCGGQLRPIPFWTYRQIAADALREVFDRPLAEWGIPPFAVIEIAQGDRHKSFVVGEGSLVGQSLGAIR